METSLPASVQTSDSTPEPRVATPLVVVSLKAYMGAAQTATWLSGVRRAALEVERTDLTVVPSFPLIPQAAETLAGTPVRWGAQNVAPSDHGAQTGEVTATLLAELGCTLVVVGHAERRSRFGDTPAEIRAKVTCLSKAGITPLLCVGELEQTSPAQAAAQAIDQLTVSLAGTQIHDVIVGYEPVWAIGAAEPAPFDHVSQVSDLLRDHLRSAGIDARVLYGGAAGPGTLSALWPHIDGVFLGRFAHDTRALSAVLHEADALARSITT